MTTMADKIWISAGIDASELKSLKGRGALYLGMAAMLGLSLTFAGLALANILERLF